MGTKWSTVSTSTYADNSPTDDGAATEANRIKYATIRSDLTDPLDTAIDQIVSNLDALFDEGTVAKSGPYTTVASDHKKLLEVTGAQTITLLAAATAGAGYRVAIKSDASSTVTVSRSGTDTIDGQTSVSLGADSFAIFIVNAAGNGYISDFNDVFTSLSVDTINEKTAAAGVTVDGVLLKDGGAVFADGATIEVDTINEATAAAGVTADGVLLQDGKVLLPNGGQIKNTAATGSLEMSAGTATASAGSFEAYGESHASFPGNVYIGGSGDITLRHYNGSGWERNLVLGASATTFNVESLDQDFTVKTQSFGYAFVIDGQTGNVGMGTTPTARLHVTNTGSGDSFLVEDEANPDSDPFVIDANGRIVQGHTATLAGGSAASFEQHSTSNYDNVGAPNVSLASWSSNGTFAGGLTFDRSLSGTVGTETSVLNGTELGSIYWRGTDGSGFLQAAEILGEMDATPAGSGVDMPGRLVFSTTAAGATAPSERMRIDSAGNIGVGTSSPLEKIHVSGTGETMLVTPVTYSTSVDAPYLVAAATSYDGASANWGAYGFQHRIKSDSGGYGRVTIDSYLGEAFCVTSAGYVGVGNSSPIGPLHVGTDFAVDSSGLVLINSVSSADLASRSVGGYVHGVQIESEVTNNGASLSINRVANDSSGAMLSISKQRTDDNTGAIQSNDILGQIRWCGSDGTSATTATAVVRANAGATWTGSDRETELQFHTTPSGSTALTQSMVLTGDGRLGLGTSAPTETIDVNSDAIRVRTSQTPASASATGDAGQICWDANYIYVCTATNTWKRSALATW